MDDMDFSFRFKIHMAPSKRLALQEHEWTMPDFDGHRVVLTAAKMDESLQDAEWIIVWGSGYGSDEEARSAGNQYRDRLERAFAALRIGADFGDRSRQGLVLARAIVEKLEQDSGRPVLADRHGLMTFQTELSPIIFGGGGAHVYAAPPREQVVAALCDDAAREPVTTQGRLAFELFGASAFIARFSPEARFMLLMMAVEALLACEPRSNEAQALVTSWRDALKDADLPAVERDSLMGALGFLVRESISQAGRRMAQSLAGNTYDEREPERFFAEAYSLRSRLAHPTAPGPSRQDVERLLGPLENFVGDLLAGPRLLMALAPKGAGLD